MWRRYLYLWWYFILLWHLIVSATHLNGSGFYDIWRKITKSIASARKKLNPPRSQVVQPRWDGSWSLIKRIDWRLENDGGKKKVDFNGRFVPAHNSFWFPQFQNLQGKSKNMFKKRSQRNAHSWSSKQIWWCWGAAPIVWIVWRVEPRCTSECTVIFNTPQ